MPPAARITDMHVCPMVTGVVPHVGGPILPPGCPTVLIGFLPAARATDVATCVGPPDSIMMGSPTVLIGNLMAARIGDPTVHGGVIVLGCPTVIIGEAGMGSPSPPSAPSIPGEPTAAMAPGGSVSASGGPSSNLEAEAESPGRTPFQRSAREQLARDFYVANCPDMTEAEIESHLKCIDFNEPIKIVKLPPNGGGPKGDQVWQWTVRGDPTGQYFTNNPQITPGQLGANNRAPRRDEDTGALHYHYRELRSYSADAGQPTVGVQSTARATVDKWTDPKNPKLVPGGGTQIFVPHGSQGALSQDPRTRR